MMILSQDGMVAVNSDNVAMFEVKETETIPHEAQLMATIFYFRRRTLHQRRAHLLPYWDVPQP